MKYYRRTCEEIFPLEEKVQNYMNQLENSNTVNELMGNEANARKEYYKMFDLILPTPFKFETRSMRPPKNMFNSLLSFGNSLVYSTVLSEIYTTHLDPTISFLHELYDRRFSYLLISAKSSNPIV